MGNFVHVAKKSEIPSGEGRSFEIQGENIGIFNVGDSFYALDNICPHQGGPLGEGFLDGKTLTCPWHAWEFDVTSGMCLGNPKLVQKKYNLKIQDEDLLVEI